jgi:hypothetical protein
LDLVPERTREIQANTQRVKNKFDVFGGQPDESSSVLVENILKCKSKVPVLEFWANRGEEFPI